MQFFKTLVFSALAATIAHANPIKNPFSPIPGYPFGNGFCLTDEQANFIANTFNTILTNPDRNYTSALAAEFVSVNYTETSDSINLLAGFPIGGPTFVGRASFIANVAAVGVFPPITTFWIVHDCNSVIWHWQIAPFGTNRYPVKGIQRMQVVNVNSGVLLNTDVEYNSLAFAYDQGYTCQPPAQLPF